MRIINAPVPCLEASKLLGPKARPFYKRLARRNTRHALLRWVKTEVDSVMREREEDQQTVSFTHTFLKLVPTAAQQTVFPYVAESFAEDRWSSPSDRMLHERNGQVLASCDMSDMNLLAA